MYITEDRVQYMSIVYQHKPKLVNASLTLSEKKLCGGDVGWTRMSPHRVCGMDQPGLVQHDSIIHHLVW
ncbi:hypothetical protein RRG08_047766 [Elysia crispata]|uniref:Uncharacterized protein n=1 Tax=Elysia crispata TaxID=231223 RepID=A0AAE0YXB4_9GAST|nr:hypothetical protein RRG08_047766 [Elysia crispata]